MLGCLWLVESRKANELLCEEFKLANTSSSSCNRKGRADDIFAAKRSWPLPELAVELCELLQSWFKNANTSSASSASERPSNELDERGAKPVAEADESLLMEVDDGN